MDETYNKIVNALKAGGTSSGINVPLVTTEAITFEGTRKEYALRPGSKEGDAGWNMKSVLDFDSISKPNAAGKYLLDYRDDGEVAAALEKRFKRAGFTFAATPYRNDTVTVTYTFKDGRTKTLNFTTDRSKTSSRKKDETGLINWMNGRINEDSYWTEEGSGTQYAGASDEFDI